MGEAKRRKNGPASGERRVRVIIGVPSGSHWWADTAMAFAALAARSARYVDIILLNGKGSHISKQRNDMVEKALASGADYLLQIDSDMVFPPDALLRLIEHQKDIVGATYNKRLPPYETLGKMIGPAPNPLPTSGLLEAESMPGGFMLIDLKVFRSIPYPWYFELYDDVRFSDRCRGEDYSFSAKAREHGFKLWCDLDLTVEMAHIGEHHVTCIRPPSRDATEVLGYEPALT